MNATSMLRLLALVALSWAVQAFVVPSVVGRSATRMAAAAADGEEKLAKQVTGEELELMLTEWEQPLVIDAYATW